MIPLSANTFVLAFEFANVRRTTSVNDSQVLLSTRYLPRFVMSAQEGTRVLSTELDSFFWT